MCLWPIFILVGTSHARAGRTGNSKLVSSMAQQPFIGSKISLVSVADMRYEGILFAINTDEATVALNNVRSFGTEGRKATTGEPEVAPSPQIYEFIIFRGKWRATGLVMTRSRQGHQRPHCL